MRFAPFPPWGNLGTDSEHEKFMSLGLSGDHRAEMGEVYLTGTSGEPPRGMHGNIGKINEKLKMLIKFHYT